MILKGPGNGSGHGGVGVLVLGKARGGVHLRVPVCSSKADDIFSREPLRAHPMRPADN